MEVLSVQNQYQGQFGVIGSSKVKDWTSPLTPPPPPPPATNNHTTTTSISSTAALNQRNQQQLKQQQQQQQQSSRQRNGSNQYTEQQQTANNTQDVDVVDGGGRPAQQQPHTKHQPHQQQQHHYYHNNHHYGVTHYNHHQQHHHHHQQQHHQQQTTHLLQHHKIAAGQQAYQQQTQRAMEAVPADPTSNGEYVYNNNLFGYEDPTLATTRFGSAGHDIDVAAVNELAQRVQAELRAAKSRHLACTEVSLPYDLMPRIAEEIIKASEREPCGVRGCSLYIDFEDEPNNVRRIASFQVDPNTVSTFELYLTLKQDKSGWTSLLPQFLKNLTRSNTILISPAFTLTKNKLYACD